MSKKHKSPYTDILVDDAPVREEEPEQIIINASNGNQLYWNARKNRWFILGVSEEQQNKPRQIAAIAPPAFVFEQLSPLVDEGPQPAAEIQYIDTNIYLDKKFSFKDISTKKKEMYFEDYSIKDQVIIVKREFTNLLKKTFEHPESLKDLISNKLLSKEEAKLIFKTLNKFNSSGCFCCRRFDQKLITMPISKELEPLIDIAKHNARTRRH